MNLICFLISIEICSICFLLPKGKIISLIPSEKTAKHFYFIPPTGNTLPFKVISPVIAIFYFTFFPVNKLT